MLFTRPAHLTAAVIALAVVSLSIALPQLKLEERALLFLDVYTTLTTVPPKREES